MKKTKAVIVTGPTATGKTALAVKLARMFDGEIISADSRQVYKGLDLGTGKDIEEYGTGKNTIKYHLIDICEPEQFYNLKQFNTESRKLIDTISKNNKLPIISGGTALYIDSLISNYEFPISAPDFELRDNLKDKTTTELAEYLKSNQPELYKGLENKTSRPRIIRAIESIQSTNKTFNRPNILSSENIEWLILGTYFPRKEVHERIKTRLEQRIDCGMIDEVKSLHQSGLSWERLDAFGLEYRYISKYLQGELSLDEMKELLLAKIRRLARSQDIWFRKMERKGHQIHWLQKGDFNEADKLISKFINNDEIPQPKLRLMDVYYGPKS